MADDHWIQLQQDAETGIETLRAHFEGHAYDPHWHDAYLVGYTEQGLQQFHCRGQRHRSTPGQVFLLEPGELHDGQAPEAEGFTYSMLYLDPQWLARELQGLHGDARPLGEPGFARTLVEQAELHRAVAWAHEVLSRPELRIVRQSALDALLLRLLPHLQWRAPQAGDPRLPQVALRARDILHAHHHEDIGLEELARACGVDRFRLTRAFKAAFGLAPHAYLVQLRLSRARRLLADGLSPADTAAALGFADQSHLGRWFRRAYGLTPAAYRARCSNLPDR
ncbi:AraC family transcriptional regulator [Pseudomonas rhizoryzae]|uniref:AraC family transcriptional regulator n=1 Tax=Pseudomonas rhizoryzae TaxID=2571129 RepID=UPI000736EBC6|nr:AraC family transcriptional regulator [Pseudomonas rhizoryzae]APQ12508.1 AraC family transcriptional regulator [Pseudomonas psychrotolerans]KTT31846.1 AraC family transcriptional regulator [Pseudomonas psychrotolerans]KTT37162.1 AraC family transcriptional regulator [Pseudomonas psychrotolerans]KTT77355.1 AraC family transcriptional regulator [Pseudomonas psychrotolerans]